MCTLAPGSPRVGECSLEGRLPRRGLGLQSLSVITFIQERRCHEANHQNRDGNSDETRSTDAVLRVHLLTLGLSVHKDFCPSDVHEIYLRWPSDDNLTGDYP